MIEGSKTILENDISYITLNDEEVSHDNLKDKLNKNKKQGKLIFHLMSGMRDIYDCYRNEKDEFFMKVICKSNGYSSGVVILQEKGPYVLIDDDFHMTYSKFNTKFKDFYYDFRSPERLNLVTKRLLKKVNTFFGEEVLDISLINDWYKLVSLQNTLGYNSFARAVNKSTKERIKTTVSDEVKLRIDYSVKYYSDNQYNTLEELIRAI